MHCDQNDSFHGLGVEFEKEAVFIYKLTSASWSRSWSETQKVSQILTYIKSKE